MTEPSVAPLSSADLDALGLAGFVQNCAELAPAPPTESIAQGRGAVALIASVLSLAELVAHPTIAFAELGLPGLAEEGWTVEREHNHPYVLWLRRGDGAVIEPPPQLAADRSLDLRDRGLILDLRGCQPILGLRSGARGLVIQVSADTAQAFHALSQPFGLEPMPELRPDVSQWVSPSDAWLVAHLCELAASRDPTDGLVSAAMTYRWHDGPGFVAEEPPAVKWVRTLDPALTARIERLLVSRADQLAEQLAALADDPSDDPAWRAAMDRQFVERAYLEGSRRLLGQHGALPALDAALSAVDRFGRLLVAALPAWPVSDGELARRAWLADADSWWSAHEAERAATLDAVQDEDE